MVQEVGRDCYAIEWICDCECACGYLVVSERIEALPVIIDLCGDVFVLEDDSSHSTLTPFYTWGGKCEMFRLAAGSHSFTED